MHITINIDTAEEMSDLDRQVIALLSGQEFVLGTLEETEEDGEGVEDYVDEEEVEEEPEPAPKKTTSRRKKPEPEPEEEPEEMAEEPVEEEEPEEEEEGGFDEDMSDEDLLSLAIKKATEMVGGGKAAEVREALDAAGASRVRELNADNVREFFKALDG